MESPECSFTILSVACTNRCILDRTIARSTKASFRRLNKCSVFQCSPARRLRRRLPTMREALILRHSTAATLTETVLNCNSLFDSLILSFESLHFSVCANPVATLSMTVTGSSRRASFDLTSNRLPIYFFEYFNASRAFTTNNGNPSFARYVLT